MELRLHADVVTSLKLKVESLTPLPTPAERPVEARGREARGPAKEGEATPKTEKRGKRPPAKAEATEKPAKGEKAEKSEKQK